MAKRKKAVNRRKSAGGPPRLLLPLGIVVALIVLGLFALERVRKVTPPKGVTQQVPVPTRKMPARPAPRQETLSSAVVVQAPKPPAPPARHEVPLKLTGKGTLAIIVDDMGSSTQQVQQLVSIHVPITFSVIPSLGKAKAVAEAAHDAGAQVMVHMPMEPQGYPKQPMEKIGLLVSMDDAEIEQRVRGYFAFVPHAEGANNHMGSRFTESAEKMEPVLKVLKEKGLFFVDSRTSPKSVAYETAKSDGLKSATRQVFLDNVQDVAAIKKQLAQAAAIAIKRGSAIAICHPHPATIKALQEMLPEFAKGGIVFVHASELVS